MSPSTQRNHQGLWCVSEALMAAINWRSSCIRSGRRRTRYTLRCYRVLRVVYILISTFYRYCFLAPNYPCVRRLSGRIHTRPFAVERNICSLTPCFDLPSTHSNWSLRLSLVSKISVCWWLFSHRRSGAWCWQRRGLMGVIHAKLLTFSLYLGSSISTWSRLTGLVCNSVGIGSVDNIICKLFTPFSGALAVFR